jgi:hypothetical protein
MALQDQDPLIMILRIIAITIGYIIGILMIRMTRKAQVKNTKRYFRGATEFFIVYSICRTIFLMGAIFDDPLRLSYYLGNTLGLASLVFIIEAIEATIFTKSKHILTAYGIVGVSVMIFDNFARIKIGKYSLVALTQYVCMVPLAGVVLLIYLRATIKSRGKMRRNGFIMFLGIFFLALSETGNTEDAVGILGEGLYFVSPIVLVTSLILLYYSIVTAVEMEETDVLDKSLAKTIILTRPPKITEEEIKFYREKTICMVCKGKLEGYGIFLCGGCKSLYCEMCARTLEELENACWACYSPIDKSRPVKLEEPGKTVKKEIIHKKSKI